MAGFTFSQVAVEDIAEAAPRKGRAPSAQFHALVDAITNMTTGDVFVTPLVDVKYSTAYQFAARARKAAGRIADITIGKATLKNGTPVLRIAVVTAD